MQLSNKIPAVVNYSRVKGSVEIREIDLPEIGKNDVLLEVENVGVCGSDLHQWTSDHSWEVNYPVVLGHEFGGSIAKLGENVKNWNIGDRVVSETAAIIDMQNPMSKIGLYNLDPTRKGFGYGVNGAMTKFVSTPARCLHAVPENLSFEEACLTEPCCVAYNAVAVNSNVRPGDRVLIIGPGTIGILCGAIAKICGAEVAILGLEKDKERLLIAKKYDIKTIINNASKWAKEKDGLGVDLVVDAAGVSDSLLIAMDLVRPNGQITKVGWGPKPLGFSIDPIVQKNISLQGSFSHNWPIWERVIQLLSNGSLNVRPIIGGIWPITNWEKAFTEMYSGKIVKSILKPV
ncbi:MAG: Zn-dependent alcohol dehydrogenase [Flavobacteriaceae bacterium]|nr:Zn-dependent alcohol dehydrogenase [Flavobacteriaceae bacterium]